MAGSRANAGKEQKLPSVLLANNMTRDDRRHSFGAKKHQEGVIFGVTLHLVRA